MEIKKICNNEELHTQMSGASLYHNFRKRASVDMTKSKLVLKSTQVKRFALNQSLFLDSSYP